MGKPGYPLPGLARAKRGGGGHRDGAPWQQGHGAWGCSPPSRALCCGEAQEELSGEVRACCAPAAPCFPSYTVQLAGCLHRPELILAAQRFPLLPCTPACLPSGGGTRHPVPSLLVGETRVVRTTPPLLVPCASVSPAQLCSPQAFPWCLLPAHHRCCPHQPGHMWVKSRIRAGCCSCTLGRGTSFGPQVLSPRSWERSCGPALGLPSAPGFGDAKGTCCGVRESDITRRGADLGGDAEGRCAFCPRGDPMV